MDFCAWGGGGGWDYVASHSFLEKEKIKWKTIVIIMTEMKASTLDRHLYVISVS